MNKNNEQTQEAKMLEKIRLLLGLTIDDFVEQMQWKNSKYYSYIKNGRKRSGDKEKKFAHPTIHKVFTGINKAIEQRSNWKEKSDDIKEIIISHLLPATK